MTKTLDKNPPKYAIIVDAQIQNYLLSILKDRVKDGLEIEELQIALDTYKSIIAVVEIHSQESEQVVEE